MLSGDLLLPEVVGDLGLQNTVLCQICVGPNGSTVAVQLRPVALCKWLDRFAVMVDLITYVPSSSAIVALSGVVKAFAMTSHEKHLVHCV